MNKLPLSLKKYFWDVDFSKLDKDDFSYFIIERLLEYGDTEDTEWMKNNFKESEIKEVTLNSKRLSKRSSNFWHLFFKLCKKKSSQNKGELIWKH